MVISEKERTIIEDAARSVVSLVEPAKSDWAKTNIKLAWDDLGAVAVKYPYPTISICWLPIPRRFDVMIFPNLSCEPVRLTVAPVAEAEARAG